MDKESCLHEILNQLPICNQVFKYAKTGKRRFHTPGHKGQGHALSEILQIANDVTEVENLDNLLNPSLCIKASMQNLSTAFKSVATYFVTSGGTTAVLASVFALKECKKIAITRSCHSSIYNALEISGVEPYIINDLDEFGRTVEITEKLIESALSDQSVGAFLLTRPSYTGDCFDLEKISNLIKSKNKYLIIDEAHGTHFVFSKEFPTYAGKCADIVINSTHKTLPTLTGGALLSCYNKKIAHQVESAYHMFQSTSPSYLTLMSIEYAVYLMQHNEELLDKLVQASLNLKARLLAKGVKLHKCEDVTRLVIDAEALCVSGKELDMRLQEQKVFCEYSSLNEVVFILTVFDDEKELFELGDIIIDCVFQCGEINVKKRAFPNSAERKLSYLQARKSIVEQIEIDKAEGRICSENFGIYPPARPLAVAGEKITRQMIEFAQVPFDFYGITDNKIWVVKE